MDMISAETAATHPLDAGDATRRRKRERRRALTRTLRQALVGLVVLAATVGAVFALRPRPVPIDLAHAARGPLVVAIEESGSV